MAYPSPFFDVGHTYLPDTVKRMFRWCRYYYLTNPIIAAVVNKMAEYPVTDVIVESDNPGMAEHWQEFLEDVIRLRALLINIGLYFMCYGNAELSMSYPFIKFLRCSYCGTWHSIRDLRYRFHGFRFVIQDCPKCGGTGEAKVKDVYVKSPREIKVILWNPEDVHVVHNDITGEDTYFYKIPKGLRNDIQLGKPHIIEGLPQIIIDAVRKQRAVKLNKDNIYHMRRPSILTGVRDSGVGIPLLLPVLKDTFYLQVLKKANEQIALERAVPLSILFPQGTQTLDVYQSVDLTKWRDQIQQEIARWRIDRAYIPLMPLPVGHQIIGGDGRALMLSQEIKIWSDQIIAGMGVPAELIYGGLQWSGSNVSLRMLENHFIGYISDLNRFVNKFLIKNVAAFLDWPHVDTRFKPFKMADDLQRKALMFQYNSAGKISDRTLLSDSDLEPDKENEIMEAETSARMQAVKKQQMAQAEIQGAAQLVMAKYQARAQTVMVEEQMKAQQGTEDAAPGEAREGIAGGLPQAAPQQPQQPQQQPQQPVPQAQPVPEVVQQIALQISNMPPEYQSMAVQQIAQHNPVLAQAVAQHLRSSTTGPASASKPLPEALPPRRGAESAAI
jgi:hypothetical protein